MNVSLSSGLDLVKQKHIHVCKPCVNMNLIEFDTCIYLETKFYQHYCFLIFKMICNLLI